MRVRKILERAGVKIISTRDGGEAMAMCPFHGDSNPSFSINLNTGLWHCFAGCGGGAIQDLLKKLNVEGFELKSVSQENIEKEEELSKKRVLHPITEEQLATYPSAKNNLFLLKRGVSNEDIKEWELKIVGLEIVIPVRDTSRILVGAAKRVIVVEEGESKYKNSEGFKKTHFLFGAHKFFSKKGTVILVEGLFDVIRLHSLGFKNSLSILGLDIHRPQIEILKSLGISRILLFMDNDKEGKEVIGRNAQVLISAGFPVYIPNYQNMRGKDAGDMKSREEVLSVIENSVSYLKYKLGGNDNHG